MHINYIVFWIFYDKHYYKKYITGIRYSNYYAHSYTYSILMLLSVSASDDSIANLLKRPNRLAWYSIPLCI